MMAVACVCVCGFVSIACVCILQGVSRVAHVNDCVEDRSERRLTLSWHLCVLALLLFRFREVLFLSL